MVVESLVVCEDLSDYMRNGDFYPSRLVVQSDAVDWLARCHLALNPDNEMACVGMRDNKAQVLVPFTRHWLAKSKLTQMPPNGVVHLGTSIRLALLILSHRPVSKHKKRLVLFLGSPLEAVNETRWSELGKRLKKQGVVIDVILFGSQHEVRHNQHTLQAFLQSLGTKLNHLILIHSGASLLLALQRQLGLPTEALNDTFDYELNLAIQQSLLKSSTQQSQLTSRNPNSSTLDKNKTKQALPAKSHTKDQQKSADLKVSKLLIRSPKLKQSRINQNKPPFVKSSISKNHKLVKSLIVKPSSHKIQSSKFTTQPSSPVKCLSSTKSLEKVILKQTTSTFFKNPFLNWPAEQKWNHSGKLNVKSFDESQCQTLLKKPNSLIKQVSKENNPTSLGKSHCKTLLKSPNSLIKQAFKENNLTSVKNDHHIPRIMPPNIDNDHVKTNLSNTKNIPTKCILEKLNKNMNNTNNDESKK